MEKNLYTLDKYMTSFKEDFLISGQSNTFPDLEDLSQNEAIETNMMFKLKYILEDTDYYKFFKTRVVATIGPSSR